MIMALPLARHHGVGLTEEEFHREIGSRNHITDVEQRRLINSGEFGRDSSKVNAKTAGSVKN